MMEINGVYANAIVYTDEIEASAAGQIQALCDQPFAAGSRIRGLGNDDWNQSAPHGAGRLFSRSQAESSFTLSAFKKSMEGIYTSTVSQDTLDECPMAYKDPRTIIAAIGDSVRIEKQIRPIYNLVEKWRDAGALALHGKEPHFARIRALKLQYVTDTRTERFER